MKGFSYEVNRAVMLIRTVERDRLEPELLAHGARRLLVLRGEQAGAMRWGASGDRCGGMGPGETGGGTVGMIPVGTWHTRLEPKTHSIDG